MKKEIKLTPKIRLKQKKVDNYVKKPKDLKLNIIKPKKKKSPKKLRPINGYKVKEGTTKTT